MTTVAERLTRSSRRDTACRYQTDAVQPSRMKRFGRRVVAYCLVPAVSLHWSVGRFRLLALPFRLYA
jgi:hypothetical protein